MPGFGGGTGFNEQRDGTTTCNCPDFLGALCRCLWSTIVGLETPGVTAAESAGESVNSINGKLI